MMRRKVLKILPALAVVAIMTSALQMVPAAAQTVDRLGVPGPIQFDGVSFNLASSSKPSDNYTRQAYLPTGQTLQSYRQMLLVERVTGNLKTMDAARAQTQMLQQRKASDPLVNMNVMQHPESGEVLLDFIVSSKDTAGGLIVEWNAYRYALASGGSSGVVLFGISHRAYGAEDAKTFLSGLRALRPAQINAVAKAALPVTR